ncbi:chromate efflux transporter [Halococcus sp. IIIV-5B]|nr:chromate efflux transporter [Halococcus sp. IIIV-5B]
MPDETRHAEPGVDSSDDQSAISVPFREAIWIWVQVAVYSFGGAAGQISVMHKLLVEKKRWIDEERFLHAMNFTMLLPGPEAQQLATYIGWLLHKTKGGIVAGTLFVLPGFVSILLLSILYVEFRQFTTVEALFFGLQAAVLAIVAEAVLRIGKRVLKNAFMIGIAAGAFIGIFAFNILFPIIIIGAALVGVLGYRLFPGIFSELTGSQSDDSETETVMSTDFAHHTQPSTRRSLKVATLWLGLWLIPLVTMIAVLGRESIFVQQGTFFSTVAVIVFGGAYAVLAYVAQEAVLTYGWLEPGEMIDGLGMAETTPGPTIQVVQFVGFMGAYRNPGTFDPLVAGVVGSIIVTWVTFIPCFLFIFLGAPYIEYLRGRESLSAALSAVTAAVVGVILNLAIWFAIHVLFANQVRFEGFGMSVLIPVVETLDPAALAIVLGSFGLIFGFNQGMMRTLTAAMVAGLVYYLVVL